MKARCPSRETISWLALEVSITVFLGGATGEFQGSRFCRHRLHRDSVQVRAMGGDDKVPSQPPKPRTIRLMVPALSTFGLSRVTMDRMDLSGRRGGEG